MSGNDDPCRRFRSVAVFLGVAIALVFALPAQADRRPEPRAALLKLSRLVTRDGPTPRSVCGAFTRHFQHRVGCDRIVRVLSGDRAYARCMSALTVDGTEPRPHNRARVEFHCELRGKTAYGAARMGGRARSWKIEQLSFGFSD